mmetsp:Transcript_23263/g.39420  ORF Transcript_23263/g.39420 Transcript_23263/m.39420 type:complete len:376 (-) Transcript_23263:204-1331(-)|eukprot:CAMPEP_0114431892 /NCGR_PEP_ID=MMETSP0103-20121206/10858_1 /TAXON_ID=37642 ORGANISM="Paraphysomonas imperforata, Strain PA2" /NCGR_SAMPLE_ID=MMETSP0103 /ASSEMBLY_ACC=CAM_ASM_000201 /LENGTH=375 /DNA_ID=CAMNT_0001601519 /DNA_START=159 /DNA_END=1286 /DNA_ORIENTATION=-
MHGNDESEEMSEMEQQVVALTGLLEEGLVSQEKYDILVVKIMSGEMPDLLGDSEDTMQGENDDDYDDRSIESRSSSLFNVHDGPIDELSSDEEDENLKNNIVMSNMGFSALYKQNSLVEVRDNPSEVNPQGVPLPPLPPPSHSTGSSGGDGGSSHNAVRKHLNMVMMGGKPKNAKKKQLASSTSTEAGAEDSKAKSSAKRGFFRQTSSFEAAKYNPSLAAGLKKNQFDVIMIDGNEFPPPADPPAAGDIPPPPPLQLPTRGAGGGRIPPLLESEPHHEDVDKSNPKERLSQERPTQETVQTGGARESSFQSEATEQTERETNDRDTSVTSMTSLSQLDTSYKNKQFAMKPELLSAALKKRSQWTLNRHDSNEFYN